MSTRVVNVKEDQYDIFIGRPSKWGNPFRIGLDGTRKKVIELHEKYLYTQPLLIQEIKKELKDKILGCYCYPLSCHGDILVRIANDYQLCMPLY